MVGVAKDLDPVILSPSGDCPVEEASLAGLDGLDPYGLLELEDQARPNRLFADAFNVETPRTL